MDISCHNGNTSYLVECCQYYNHTYQRIRLLLPMDIFMAAPLPQAVRVGSCLWDLSTGCTDSVNVTVEYQQRYRGAILLIRQAILEVIPGAMSYWRTCPPISQKYSDSSIQNGEGCNRRNQQVLNNILRETANDPILNWWQLFRDVPEAIISHELELDGRHYGSSPRCPS